MANCNINVVNDGINTAVLSQDGAISTKEITINNKTGNGLRIYSSDSNNTPFLTCQTKPDGSLTCTSLSVTGTTSEMAYIRSSGAAQVESLYIGTNYVRAYKETIPLNFVKCSSWYPAGGATVSNWSTDCTQTGNGRVKIAACIF